MDMATRDFLNQNSAIISTIPGFTTQMTSLTNGITAIHSYAEVQMTDKTGVTVGKNSLRASIISLSYELSSKLCALAINTGNTVLYGEVHIPESTLLRSSDNILKERVQLIYDRANTNVTTLAPYGVTAQSLTNFQSSLNSFIAYLPKPRLTQNEKKLATMQLKQQFAIIKDSLSKIDILVETLRYSQPAFYSGYKNCRKVVNTGKHFIALKARVTDMATNEPLKGVHVKVQNADDNQSKFIEKKTAKKGGIIISNLAEGKYTVSLSIPGYTSKEMEFYVNDSALANLNIALARCLHS
jgi:5-hydroxyisourate hydrolase-like protein (transthyretin family)